MTCYHPTRAYLLINDVNENGNQVVEFDRNLVTTRAYKPIELPCNNCIGCKMDKSKDWALRCILESKCWENNCFITLTINEESLGVNRELDKTMFQKFMKRLRKKFNGIESYKTKEGRQTYPIRYLYCGEYGEQFSRPHFHALLFNFDFGDKTLWRVDKGNRIYRSGSLEYLWPYGFSEIGEVTFSSAAYVSRYVTKKVNGRAAEEHYKDLDEITGEMLKVHPEFINMSRNPGIGKIWFERFTNDIKKDCIYIDGYPHKIPKYFDRLLSEVDTKTMARNKERRSRKALERSDGKTLKRLGEKEECLREKTKRLERSYENAAI